MPEIMQPTAARGHNLVALVPPSPAYAEPALAGLAERVANGTQALLLAPQAELERWGALAERAGTPAGRIQVARGTARAERRLRAGEVGLLVADPETALALLRRSALKVEAVGAVVLAWPEHYIDDEPLAALMNDLPKDAQRLVFTSDPAQVQTFVERYARKALTLGVAPAETSAPPPIGPVRTVATSWNRRAAAVAETLELLDPARAVVWAATPAAREELSAAAVPFGPGVEFATGDAPKADVVIAYDLPTREQLAQLLSSGEVVLIAPPGTEGYVGRIATPRRPLRLPGATEAAADAAAVRRSAIAKQAEAGGGGLERALYTLGPLFERHDPTVVAAALYGLWVEGAGASAAAGPELPAGATARVFVNVGQTDGVTANDLVAVLTKEIRVERGKIGRIELRDAFSLIELPAQDAERIAQQLSGATVRRKRIAARLDRGPTKTERGSERGSRPDRGPARRRTP